MTASTTLDFLTDVEWTRPVAVTCIEIATAATDPVARATGIFMAAVLEWGAGDEYTSEAARRYILAVDSTGHPHHDRAALIREHRLDDMCPTHLTDLQPNRGDIGPAEICPDCDEEG